ncbi:MAG: hypothetical protein AB9915_00285 [Candidatus Dojkabacteria bacterium]
MSIEEYPKVLTYEKIVSEIKNNGGHLLLEKGTSVGIGVVKQMPPEQVEEREVIFGTTRNGALLTLAQDEEFYEIDDIPLVEDRKFTMYSNLFPNCDDEKISCFFKVLSEEYIERLRVYTEWKEDLIKRGRMKREIDGSGVYDVFEYESEEGKNDKIFIKELEELKIKAGREFLAEIGYPVSDDDVVLKIYIYLKVFHEDRSYYQKRSQEPRPSRTTL